MQIATRAYADGTFANVGMNQRAHVPPYRQFWRRRKWLQEFSQGHPVRVETFNSSQPYADPIRTEYLFLK